MKKDPKKRVVGQVGGWKISSNKLFCCVVCIYCFFDILIVRDVFHKIDLYSSEFGER